MSKMDNGWIPCSERYPDNDKYILLSFSNFSVPLVGRYEEDENGGAFYVGDDEESCVSHEIIVNAWQPLPVPYQDDEDVKLMSNADRIRAMSDDELADAIFRLHIDDCKEMHFCKESDRCNEILDKGELIPEEMCRACLMEWLKAATDGREEK